MIELLLSSHERKRKTFLSSILIQFLITEMKIRRCEDLHYHQRSLSRAFVLRPQARVRSHIVTHNCLIGVRGAVLTLRDEYKCLVGTCNVSQTCAIVIGPYLCLSTKESCVDSNFHRIMLRIMEKISKIKL